AFLFPAISTQAGNNLLVLLGLAIAGTLFVIPTAGEIPIIQTLASFGLGTGPAGALLLTLAPVSLPSLAMVSRVFPTRVLVAIGLSVAVIGIASGLIALTLF
ncbi:MAG: permease, partial [Chloroflexota bacterium]|nr:permease [Chloroflexota bacterium]